MPILVDTNVALRVCDRDAPEHLDCVNAIQALVRRGDDPCLCTQVLIEFWVVATRPKASNGFGWDSAEADAALGDLLRSVRCLAEPSDVGPRWRDLVTRFNVLGKQAHDARIVAVMDAHGIAPILTFECRGFLPLRACSSDHSN